MNHEVQPTVEALRSAALAMRSVATPAASAAEALQAAANGCLAQVALHLLEVDEFKLHEAAGFSSVATYARSQMGHSAKSTRTFVRIGQMLSALPQVRAAALAGDLTFEHLKSFSYALRIIDREATIEAESALLAKARELSADDFHALLRRMREATLDALDQAWHDGMDKRDLQLSKTLDGWAVTGFLPIDLGAKLKVILDSLATPRQAGDTRAPSERRLDGLESLCDAVLTHGLPSDNGVRPHLRIVVEVSDEQPRATLETFGPIGPALAAHLACEADWLSLKTRNGQVLDVGRRRRFATAKQTEAVLHRQGGICAAPGCRHRIAHIHHQQPWSRGGRTDLDNLTGYCTKCHTLEHLGTLQHARAG